MNKVPVICPPGCDFFEVNINQNSASELSLDSEHQLSYVLLDEAIKEIINGDQENENLKEAHVRYITTYYLNLSMLIYNLHCSKAKVWKQRGRKLGYRKETTKVFNNQYSCFVSIN